MKTADHIKAAKPKEAKELVKTMLLINNEWLIRGLMAIYARQTPDEQTAEDTKYHNECGFNSADSMILTSFAKQWKSRNWLSDAQMAILKKKMPKYAGQLAKIAKGTTPQ